MRVYLNEDLDETHDFDKAKDISIDIVYEDRDIELEELQTDLHKPLRKKGGEKVKTRLRDKTFNMQFFSYNDNTQIEDDDDLATEIDNIFPEDPDSDNEDRFVEIRIIFKNINDDKNLNNDNNYQLQPAQPPPLLLHLSSEPMDEDKEEEKMMETVQPPTCKAILPLSAPKLRQKRIGRYFDHKLQRMAHYVILYWDSPSDDRLNIDHDTDSKSHSYLYDIQESNTLSKDLCAQKLMKTAYRLQPLEVETEYAFHIKAYLVNTNRESTWSNPLVVNTPKVLPLLPTPRYIQIVTLMDDRLFIRFDPGFVAKSHEKLTYWYKEYNVYQSAAFGVAAHDKPFGGFDSNYKVTPNTMYQIVIWSENTTANKCSKESQPLLIKTPPSSSEFLEPSYRPNPPANISAVYNDESGEIVLFWGLPENTFGDLIEYQVTVGTSEPMMVQDLPFYMDYAETQIIEVITICDIYNQKYKSDIGFYEINANDINNVTVNAYLPQNENDIDACDDIINATDDDDDKQNIDHILRQK